LSELSRLDRLRRLFGKFLVPEGIVVGIGDDAAVVAPGETSLVWTVDAVVEGVHFRREWMSMEDIGWRSLMAAASDLAAMGARPRGVLSALILPTDVEDNDLDRLASGQAQAAAALGTAVVGGNLSRGAQLSITTSVLGEARAPLLRRGALPGDVVALCGSPGLAGAGLEAARRGLASENLSTALAAFRRPRARIEEGLAAAPHAHAAIDLSDGLVLDASRLAAEGQIGIVLEQELVVFAAGPDVAAAAAELALDPLELALYGGEDYALLAAFVRDDVPAPFVVIGSCVAEPGVFLQMAKGARRKLEPRGFDHFAG